MDPFDFNNDGKVDCGEEFMAYQSYLEWEKYIDSQPKPRRDIPEPPKRNVPEEEVSTPRFLLYLFLRVIMTFCSVVSFFAADPGEKGIAFLVCSVIGVGCFFLGKLVSPNLK